jgi:hypothetical protein
LATEHFKMGNHFVFDEARFSSLACPPGAQLLFDIGLDSFSIESPPPASAICLAPQLPMTKLKPGITNLACYIRLPLLEFTLALVATAATLVTNTPTISRYDALTIALCGNPFGPSFDKLINIQGSHATAGLLLFYDIDRCRCQITAMQPGTPADCIHIWKYCPCSAYILCINNNDVISSQCHPCC